MRLSNSELAILVSHFALGTYAAQSVTCSQSGNQASITCDPPTSDSKYGQINWDTGKIYIALEAAPHAQSPSTCSVPRGSIEATDPTGHHVYIPVDWKYGQTGSLADENGKIPHHCLRMGRQGARWRGHDGHEVLLSQRFERRRSELPVLIDLDSSRPRYAISLSRKRSCDAALHSELAERYR